MFSLIPIPGDFVASATAYIGEVFTDVSPLVMLAIGLPLAFWVIKSVIGLVRFRARK